MYSDRRGDGQKPTPDKTFQTQNFFCQNHRYNNTSITTESAKVMYVCHYCMHELLKIGRGSERCDVFWGVMRCDKGNCELRTCPRSLRDGYSGSRTHDPPVESYRLNQCAITYHFRWYNHRYNS